LCGARDRWGTGGRAEPFRPAPGRAPPQRFIRSASCRSPLIRTCLGLISFFYRWSTTILLRSIEIHALPPAFRNAVRRPLAPMRRLSPRAADGSTRRQPNSARGLGRSPREPRSGVALPDPKRGAKLPARCVVVARAHPAASDRPRSARSPSRDRTRDPPPDLEPAPRRPRRRRRRRPPAPRRPRALALERRLEGRRRARRRNACSRIAGAVVAAERVAPELTQRFDRSGRSGGGVGADLGGPSIACAVPHANSGGGRQRARANVPAEHPSAHAPASVRRRALPQTNLAPSVTIAMREYGCALGQRLRVRGITPSLAPPLRGGGQSLHGRVDEVDGSLRSVRMPTMPRGRQQQPVAVNA
jgi:hypothetical protein